VIEGCKGVIEYNDNYLKLRLSEGAIVLVGDNFDIVSFEEKTICIKGKINSLEFAV
jgi:sporulation protein YqfC